MNGDENVGGTPTDPTPNPRPADIPPSNLLTPELLEWIKGQFTDEEAAAGLREIQQTGGLTFAEVIRDLEPPAEHG